MRYDLTIKGEVYQHHRFRTAVSMRKELKVPIMGLNNIRIVVTNGKRVSTMVCLKNYTIKILNQLSNIQWQICTTNKGLLYNEKYLNSCIS